MLAQWKNSEATMVGSVSGLAYLWNWEFYWESGVGVLERVVFEVELLEEGGGVLAVVFGDDRREGHVRYTSH